jgi:hypothetical protein
MQSDEAIIWALLVVTPAAVCLTIGAVLILGRGLQHRTSPWGLRLVCLFPALLFGIPGIAILMQVAGGTEQWVAALAGAMNIGLGLLFLLSLFRQWSVLGRTKPDE